jgi:hypothetical protein
LENLLQGRIDGFLADQISAATVAWRQQKSGLVEEHPVICFCNANLWGSFATLPYF